MPVYTPATTEAFATYGVIDEGVIAQPVLTPEGVFPQFGGLEVNTSSTALQALTDAVIYLNEYRYESADGLASRILAIAALRDVLEAFDADGLPPAAELNARVADDIEALLRSPDRRGRVRHLAPDQRDNPLSQHPGHPCPGRGQSQRLLRVPADRLNQALWYLTEHRGLLSLHLRPADA